MTDYGISSNKLSVCGTKMQHCHGVLVRIICRGVLDFLLVVHAVYGAMD